MSGRVNDNKAIETQYYRPTTDGRVAQTDVPTSSTMPQSKDT